MISGLRPQQWGAEVIRRMGGEFMEDYIDTHTRVSTNSCRQTHRIEIG